jgi:hypothetical protein
MAAVGPPSTTSCSSSVLPPAYLEGKLGQEVPVPAAGTTGQWGSDPPRTRLDLASLKGIGARSLREGGDKLDNLKP